MRKGWQKEGLQRAIWTPQGTMRVRQLVSKTVKGGVVALVNINQQLEMITSVEGLGWLEMVGNDWKFALRP